MKLHKTIKNLDKIGANKIEITEDGTIYVTLDNTLELGNLVGIWEIFYKHYELEIISGNGNLILKLKHY